MEQIKNNPRMCGAAGCGARHCVRDIMLSVLIETKNDEEALARSLATLVGAVVEGMIREVVVCDAGSTDQTWRVADHAGCRFVKDTALEGTLAQAKGDWILLLEPGARLLPGWTDAVVQHVVTSTKPARFSRFNTQGSWLRRLFARHRPLSEGLLITKSQARELNASDAAALARAAKAQRIAAGIVVAEKAR